MTVSRKVIELVSLLADDIAAQFTPPELIVGCEVLDITDINEYAPNNGWIEALVAQHNRQRVRWKSNEVVEVGGFIDVVFFPGRRLFEAWGLGGASAPAVSTSADYITVDTTNFNNNLSAADDTVQKALETLDDVAGGGGADMTSIWFFAR